MLQHLTHKDRSFAEEFQTQIMIAIEEKDSRGLEDFETTALLKFLNRSPICAECLRVLWSDPAEKLAVAIELGRTWAHSTWFCRKPDTQALP